ncbi:MAG TPA: universal stress protein [Ktedonobacteraceae bacterium]|nr:universal stress protein [Ktedonobacteraceae bacterium]
MFHHLLVPLDGSSRAEEALPLAAHIARRTGGTLSLLRAVVPELAAAEGSSLYSLQAGVLAEEVQETLTQEAKEYLEHLTHSELLEGVPLRTQVLAEPPVPSILSYAQSEHVDLIMLCSHGYTGLKRWALGSVAQKIARHSPVPVVVLPERDLLSPLYHPEKTRPVRALIALDGSSLAEATLLPTAQLVALISPAATQGELHLLRVIKPPSHPEEHKYLKYDIDIQELMYREAKNYLQVVQDRLVNELAPRRNLQVTFSIEEEADVATTLIRAAEMGGGIAAESYDLIALATHGRGGIKRWLVGSITERVLEKAKLPLLIVQPDMPTASSSSSEET